MRKKVAKSRSKSKDDWSTFGEQIDQMPDYERRYMYKVTRRGKKESYEQWLEQLHRTPAGQQASEVRRFLADFWIHVPNLPERTGLSEYVVLIRANDDPEQQAKRGMREGYDPLSWKKPNLKPKEYWAEKITEHMKDGVARTFNRISVEMLDKTADILHESTFEEGLWLALESGYLKCTTEAPILFKRWDAPPLFVKGKLEDQ